jgi:DNA-binding LacI/PurR family transcriptional regulator
MGLREIAKRLGLSRSTVSLALQGSPRTAEATRRRVQAAAKKLGYRPNPHLVAAMSRLRASRVDGPVACFGVISFYDTPHPWEKLPHLPRIHEAMKQRAAELGYRIEPIWLRAPGMTYRRVRTILKARGIQGLLCFGSPEVEQEFPAELDEFAIVTLGQSIRTQLHRVTSHFFRDTWRTLERVHALGYRRPGLVLGHYDDKRSGHECASAYFGWCEQHLGSAAAMNILRVDQVEPAPLQAWIKAQRPDVLVFVHLADAIPELQASLKACRIRVPDDLGVAVVSQVIAQTKFSGMQQNQQLMGTWAVELLAARIAHLDLGIPAHPRIELVESEWLDRGSLRAPAR